MTPAPTFSREHVEVQPVLDENNVPIFIQTTQGLRQVTRAEWERMEPEWEVMDEREQEDMDDPDLQYPFDDPEDPIESGRWGFILP